MRMYFNVIKKKAERCQHVAGWTWMLTDYAQKSPRTLCNLIGDQVDSGLANWPFEVALLNGKPPKFCWPAHHKVVSNLKFENMLRNQGKVTLSVRLPACVRGGPRIWRERERERLYICIPLIHRRGGNIVYKSIFHSSNIKALISMQSGGFFF